MSKEEMYRVCVIRFHYLFAQLWAQLVVKWFLLTWWWVEVAIGSNTKSSGSWKFFVFWRFCLIWLQRIRR